MVTVDSKPANIVKTNKSSEKDLNFFCFICFSENSQVMFCSLHLGLDPRQPVQQPGRVLERMPPVRRGQIRAEL